MRRLGVLCLSSIIVVSATTNDVLHNFSELGGKPYNVSYNARSMLVGGKPVLLLSGSVHYVRSTPSMWPSIFGASGTQIVRGADAVVLYCSKDESFRAQCGGELRLLELPCEVLERHLDARLHR